MIDPRKPDYTDTPASGRRPEFGYRPGDPPDAPPLVTVVTPFFNVGAVFHETARSVLSQSLQRFEWIIVNDASTDPCAVAVLESYRARDPRVRVIDLPGNAGPGAARNAGYRAARAGLVYQLDADDLLEPTALEKCAWFLLTHPRYAFANTYDVGFGAQTYLWTNGFHGAESLTRACPLTTHAMVRAGVHAGLGGYDESIRAGMEDWEFWLRAADRGLWGATIPEFLAWYRRRADHSREWGDWDEGQRQDQFRRAMREKYPGLFAGRVPWIEPRPHQSFEGVAPRLPMEQRLSADRPRLLLIVPWLRMGGADKFNLDLLDQLERLGWEVTIACTIRSTHSWLPEFSARTPDIFVLHHFAHPVDHPLFLRYLIESRRPDVVMNSNSELAYLCLPYLRAACPGPAYVDYVHMEESYWKSGGYARHSLGAREQLDLTVVTSEHLKRWLVERGGDESRIDVRTINVDPEQWRPDPALRARVRAELDIPDAIPVILFAGRLTAQKQPKVLAATFKNLAERGEDFVALVAGDGEDRAFLQQFVRQNDLGRRVRLVGETSSSRVRELMGAADIFFLPSLWEGIALVLFEAMAAGVAFVGARVGGHSELMAEGCGVLIERSGDADDEARRYADEIAPLLRDPARREAIGRAAMQRIREHFTLDEMGDGMVASFRRAVALARSVPRPALPRTIAEECATRAVELVRVSDLADWLWAERAKAQVRASSTVEARPAPVPPAGVSALHEELVRIERSRSYRVIQRAKRTLAYRALARLRFGNGWTAAEPAEDPAVRLARIKHSRAYQLVEAVKRTGLYNLYATRRYGPDWKNPGHA